MATSTPRPKRARHGPQVAKVRTPCAVCCANKFLLLLGRSFLLCVLCGSFPFLAEHSIGATRSGFVFLDPSIDVTRTPCTAMRTDLFRGRKSAGLLHSVQRGAGHWDQLHYLIQSQELMLVRPALLMLKSSLSPVDQL